jgi:2OG-Fe(II) oxygenase superfamily
MSKLLQRLQVNRYKPGGKYDPHYDWAPSKLQEQAVTCLLCLSAVDENVGGETTFPLATPPARIRAHKGRNLHYVLLHIKMLLLLATARLQLLCCCSYSI